MSSGSMSVHSLIDKYSGQDTTSDFPPPPTSSATINTAPTTAQGPSAPAHTRKLPQSHVPPAAGAALGKPPAASPPAPSIDTEGQQRISIDNTGLLSLLGPSVTTFPYSEQAYIEALRLRSEQERTKQDYYRLEIASKNLAILQNALRAQIPVNLIPLMCIGNPPDAEKPADPEAFQKGHRKSSSSRGSSLSQPDYFSTSPVAPANYRFGGGNAGPSVPQQPYSRRPLSPAKIGAAAVANLTTPTTPYRGMALNTSAVRKNRHQRHYSMPAETGRINLNRADPNALSSSLRKGVLVMNPPPPPDLQKSPSMGATPTIQVRPSPAQPLHKQSKLTQQPSQESMTSFQHIIQFHHWKPDGTQGPSIGGGNPFRQQQAQHPSHQHKRHKSTSEPVSVDMNIPGQPSYRLEGASTRREDEASINEANEDDDDDDDDDDEDNDNEDNDLSMDTSITEGGPPGKTMPLDEPSESILDSSSNRRHTRSQLNVGRFPHDILSPYTR